MSERDEAAPARVEQAGELRSARIESLRALAALAVLTGHAFGSAHGYRPDQLYDSFVHRTLLGGGFGVFLFFALSGYLLYLPFARRDVGGGDDVDLARYARNRALRILPLYWFVVVVVLLVQEGGGSWDQWWRFVLFAENFSLETVGKVDGVMWSLVVELHFYVLLPLVALAAARLSRGTRAGAALVLGALGAASFAVHLARVQGSDDPNAPLWRYSILATFFYFAAGMLLALLRVSWEGGRPAWLRGPLAHSSAWLLASLPLWLLVFGDYGRGPLVAIAAFLVVGACVLPLEQGRPVRGLEWRPLALVGVASYSLYLWHVPLLDLIVDVAGVPGGFPGLLALSAPLALAVALLSYRLVEAPFLGLRRRWAHSTPPRVSEPARDGPRAAPTSPLGP